MGSPCIDPLGCLTLGTKKNLDYDLGREKEGWEGQQVSASGCWAPLGWAVLQGEAGRALSCDAVSKARQ